MVEMASKPSYTKLQDEQPSISKDPVEEKTIEFSGRDEGVSVTFQNVSYTLTTRTLRGRKHWALLHGITGYIAPGQMLALMGPSGCGKTTLLDVLAGRTTQGTVEGNIKVGGRHTNNKFMRRYVGYVEQQDTLLDTLTVYEMLLYTAQLKLPLSVPRAEKINRVEELIEALGLSSCSNVKIGNKMARGISRGQIRRVSLGISLITQPRVLFLDEPTAGLDAVSSDLISTYLHQLASAKGLSVCCTLHTPTAYCFAQFDRIMLLASGKLLYFGDSGSQVMEYFGGHGYVGREGDSAAESLVGIVSSIENNGFLSNMSTIFAGSSIQESNIEVLQEMNQQKPLKKVDADVELAFESDGIGGLHGGTTEEDIRQDRSTITPSWWAMWVFFRFRSMKNYMSFAFVGPRVLDKLLFSTLIAGLYNGQGSKAGLKQVISISALNFMWVVIPAFTAGAYTPAIALDRVLFYRERSDGLYRTSTYLLCKLFEEVVIILMYSLAASLLVFFVVQLRGSFLLFWLVYLTANSISVSFAYFVTAASPNLDVANAVLPAFMMVMLFFAGFLVLTGSVPYVVRWVPYVDFLKYGFSALQENHWAAVHEKVIDADNVAGIVAGKVGDFVEAIRTALSALNLDFLGGGGTDEGSAPSPEGGDGFFGNLLDSLKQKAGSAIKDITQDVTTGVVQKTLGVDIEQAVTTINSTLESVVDAVQGVVERANHTLQIQLDDIGELQWGAVVLSLLNAGPPYNAWLNWFIQTLFFFFFAGLAWLALAFVQHQRR